VALVTYQHWVVRPRDLSRLDAAFFTANGALSVWLFALTAVDILAI
jgi:4-hydroxybenzoate polyprenyltransferase